MKKRFIALCSLSIMFAFTACGNGPSAQQISDMELYGSQIGQSFEYSNSNHITDVKVAISSSKEELANVIAKQTDTLSAIDLSGLKAVVAETADFSSTYYFIGEDGVMHYIKTAAETGSSTAASEAGSSILQELAVMVNQIPPDGVYDAAAVRKIAAALSLQLDSLKSEHAEDYNAYEKLRTETSPKSDPLENENYYLKIYNNENYITFDTYSLYEDFLGKLIKSLDGKESRQAADDPEMEFNYQLTARETMLEQAKFQAQANKLSAAANKILEQNADLIETIKKEAKDEYKDDPRYLKLKMKYADLRKYEDALMNAKQYNHMAKDFKESFFAEDEITKNYLTDKASLASEYRATYYTERGKYASSLLDEEAYRKQNAAELAAYEKAASTIKAKFKDNSYEKDIDYIKNEMQYESVLQGLKDCEDKTKEIEENLKKEKADYEEALAELEEKNKENQAELQKSKEWQLVKEVIEEALAALPDDTEATTKTLYIGEANGMYWADLSEELVEKFDANRSVKTESSSYSYGGSGKSYSGGSKSYSSGSSKSGSNNDDPYANPYGYGAPKEGESLTDYIKREDPQLWKDMEDRWNNLQ